MSSFTTPLHVTPLDGGRLWKLIAPFEYHVGSLESEEVIRVPAGFVTDFASVPRALWGVFPPFWHYGKAAVVHDYCYATQLYTRKRSDEIFLEAMKVLKVPWLTRHTIYRAVRMFGWRNYGQGD